MLIAALAVTACTVKPETSIDIPGQITITAHNETADGTRTTVVSGGTQVYWEAAEEINVFCNGSGACFVSQNTEPAATAQFVGTLATLAGRGAEERIWGLYPYDPYASAYDDVLYTELPSSQVGRAGSFAKDTHLSLACSLDLNLTFFSVSGGVRFSLTQEGIESVTFEGLGNEVLAGDLSLAFGWDGPYVTSVKAGATTLTLTPPGSTFETGVWYYIESIPVTLASGFKMTFHKGEQTASISTTSSVTIARGTYGSIANADSGLVFTNENEPETLGPGDAVDLGLTVKWAACNVGATKPSEYGDSFAWGDITPYYEPGYSQSDSPVWKLGKDAGYSWTSYKWCNGEWKTLTKYNNSKSYGPVVDYKSKLEEADDAAAQAGWTGTWRTPTADEWSELIDNCTWVWTTLNGTRGYKVTGSNSNSIFLPAAGYWPETYFGEKDITGLYWGSNYNSGMPFYGAYISFAAGNKEVTYTARNFGFSVRPVTE